MNQLLFDKIEMFEQTPTKLLSEITPAESMKESELKNLTSHTETTQVFTPTDGTAKPADPTQTGQQQPVSMNVGNLVSPEMAASFFNIIIPAIAAMAINKYTDKKVLKTQLEASKDELNVIKPVLKSYLDSINFKVESPFNALILTVGIIYGSKVIEVMNGQPKGTLDTSQINIVTEEKPAKKTGRKSKYNSEAEREAARTEYQKNYRAKKSF